MSDTYPQCRRNHSTLLEISSTKFPIPRSHPALIILQMLDRVHRTCSKIILLWIMRLVRLAHLWLANSVNSHIGPSNGMMQNQDHYSNRQTNLICQNLISKKSQLFLSQSTRMILHSGTTMFAYMRIIPFF